MASTPKLTWTQAGVNLASRAGNGLLWAGPALGSRTWAATRWLGRTALYYTPDWVKNAALGVVHHPWIAGPAAATAQVAKRVMQQTPEVLAGAVEPIGQLNRGGTFDWRPFPANTQDHSDDALCPLRQVDQDLNAFALQQPPQAQGMIPHLAPLVAEAPSFSATPAALPADISLQFSVATPTATQALDPHNSALLNARSETDRQLTRLADNLSAFGSLYWMATCCHIPDSNPQEILSMVREVTAMDGNRRRPSIKEVFLRNHPHLTWVEKCKVWLVHLVVSSSWWSKTIHTYMETFLKEMRKHLLDGEWLNKAENLDAMINHLIYFVDVYKRATFAYADGKEMRAPRGMNPPRTLAEYRTVAIEAMFGQSVDKLCARFSATLMKHVFPDVQYFNSTWFLPKFGNWLLNGITRTIAHHKLPTFLFSAVTQANAATQPHYLPFIQAFTDATTRQLEKLQANLDAGISLPAAPAPPGTTHLKGAIENLIYMLEFSGLETQEAIQAKRKELEENRVARRDHSNMSIDDQIQQGIQDALVNGTETVIHHFTHPENAEELFTQLFTLVNAAFAQGEIITQRDLQTSQDKLNLVVRNLGRKIVRDEIENKVRATRPEQMIRQANQAFYNHRDDAADLLRRLEVLSHLIVEQCQRLEGGEANEIEILSHLDSIHRVLKTFSTKEQLAEDLKNLPPVEKESILRPLVPLYDNIKGQTAILLQLQEQLLLHKAHAELAQGWQKILTLLNTIGTEINNTPERALERCSPLSAVVQKIAKHLPPDAPEIRVMHQKIQRIEQALSEAMIPRGKLDLLQNLDGQLQRLKSSIETNRSESRSTNLAQIRRLRGQFPDPDRDELFPLIAQLDELREVQTEPQRERLNQMWRALREAITNIQARYEQEQATALAHLPSIPNLQSWVLQLEESYRQYAESNVRAIDDESNALRDEIAKFEKLIDEMRRPPPLAFCTPLRNKIYGSLSLGLASFISVILFPYGTAIAGLLGGAAYVGSNFLVDWQRGGRDRERAAWATGVGAVVGGVVAAAAGPTLAVVGNAVLGARASNQAIENALNKGENVVLAKILDFFERTCQFALSGNIYRPAMKIAMQEVIEAYQRE